MKRRSSSSRAARLAAALMAASLSASCVESILDPTQGRLEEGFPPSNSNRAVLTVRNETMQPVHEHYVRECGSADWGRNLGPLAAGKSGSRGWGTGCYDLRASGEQRDWERHDVELAGGKRIVWRLR